MKNKKLVLIVTAVLILAVGVGVGAYAASNYGTQADPLVAKSYLDKTLTPQLQTEFQTKLDAEVKKLEDEIAGIGGGNFIAVSLSAGQTLSADAGCEIILRSGSAEASGGTGLSDVTEGTNVTERQGIPQNHLLVASSDGDGVKAASSATLLVRGGYKLA